MRTYEKPIQDQVLRFIFERGGPTTVQQIMDETRLKKTAVYTALTDLKIKKLILSVRMKSKGPAYNAANVYLINPDSDSQIEAQMSRDDDDGQERPSVPNVPMVERAIMLKKTTTTCGWAGL